MALNDLPLDLQIAIQQGYLERDFQDALRAKIGFRAIADRETFSGGIGETITKTRTGLLPAVTTPLPPAAVTDFTSGMAPNNYGVEQYTLGVNQYGTPLYLNVVTQKVAIADFYLRNAMVLGENAARSVDTLALNALFSVYMGGNTRVITTLGSAGTTLTVDDIRGFQNSWTSNNAPQATSITVPMQVTVGSNIYTCIGATPATTNISTAPGGISGTLTFSTNVTVADGTAANAVVSVVAPTVIRPSTSSGGVMATTTAAISSSSDLNNGKLTIQMLLTAKAQLEANAVPPVSATGLYNAYADPIHLTGLYQDPAFQYFFRGRPDTAEYKRGAIAELLGMSVMETNLNPIQTNISSTVGGNVHRAVVCGQGALVEGVFTMEGYQAAQAVDDGDNMITVVDGIAHVTREPLDALKQVVTQSWAYIGGFVAPTDITTTPTTIPTATDAAWKRAIIVESL